MLHETPESRTAGPISAGTWVRPALLYLVVSVLWRLAILPIVRGGGRPMAVDWSRVYASSAGVLIRGVVIGAVFGFIWAAGMERQRNRGR